LRLNYKIERIKHCNFPLIISGELWPWYQPWKNFPSLCVEKMGLPDSYLRRAPG